MASDRSTSRAFYWELPSTTVQQLQGNAFEQRVSSIVAHTLRVGLQLVAGAQQLTFATDIAPESATHLRTKKYLVIATQKAAKLKTDTVSKDKFFPLRLAGPSMQFIMQQFPLAMPNSFSIEFIYKLALLRVFGFGNLAYMDLLLQTYDPQADRNTQITALHGLIDPWIAIPKPRKDGKQGAGKLSKPVYGQLMMPRGHIKKMLEKLHDFTLKFYNTNSTASSLMPFTTAYDLFSGFKIPNAKGGGIIAWLFIADLAEYGLVALPSLDDLAAHMATQENKKEPLGPVSALMHIAKWTDIDCPRNKDDLLALLTTVWNNILDPTATLPEILSLQLECTRVQGRALNIIDLEHVLCKISRQINQTDMSEKEKKKRKRKGGDPDPEPEEEGNEDADEGDGGKDGDEDGEEDEAQDEEVEEAPKKKARTALENEHSDPTQEKQAPTIDNYDPNEYFINGLGQLVAYTNEDAEGEEFDEEAERAFYGFDTVTT